MRKLATLSSSSSAVRGKLQAALYYGRKRKHPGDFSQVFALAIGDENSISTSGVRNVPSEFEQDDFTLTFENASTAEFVWDTDHWELNSGEFPAEAGVAVLTQGDLEVYIRWTGATIEEEE